MTENRRIRVDTALLRQAATKMDGVGGKTGDIIATLRNNLNAQGEPWGDDDYGDKFVKGDKGYGTSSKNLLTGGDNMADSAKKFSKGMRDAATKMDDMDGGK
ncbi:hypothetical protein NBRGN_021_00100 [Nocardia brasiliensis NBRC 14402]|uniref:hypothetical protein n=1 Tax=Nocardia brasiliensis TaxID=37326 RepID=UPI0002FCC2A8|nr:hypothetical protein [Nocardia brasiliensis]ASF07578.1 hypothetical protein CEQ30_09640 [Nocardia brasiliensis]GAJ80019.1 hypothetical protein NBRGN_021_00100 [Nocardia brasiliensis NBRC 14402]SUB54884.1 Uncharacterised protein [Nocardia brasiliensis]